MQPVESILRAEARLGEVPVWSQRDRRLFWVDIRAPALHALDPATGENQAWPMPEPIGAVALHAEGGLLVALASGLARFDPGRAVLTPLQPIEADIATSRLNDGRCGHRCGGLALGSAFRRRAPDPLPPGRRHRSRHSPAGGMADRVLLRGR